MLDMLQTVEFVGFDNYSAVEARAMYESLGSHEPTHSMTVEAREIAGVPVRIVRPNPTARPRGTLVWIHGGGWVIGSAGLSVPLACEIARVANCSVVSVDYRLAPEHPAPAARQDCEAVIEWLMKHGSEIGVDPAVLAVGGDSAGGNLSALMGIRFPQLRHQLLVYPATDLTLSFPSIEQNAQGYLLTKSAMKWFLGLYLGESDPADPSVSPWFVSDELLRSVPSITLVTAGYDPLRDEGEAYAQRASALGVEVVARQWPGQIHGFVSLGDFIPEAIEATELIGTRLKAAFAN